MAALQSQINAACKKFHPEYSALYVSWNDNSRQQGSAFGNNITDARLKGKNGQDFLVIRPSNFNEKIGRVKATEVAVVTGNHTNNGDLQPRTLYDVLRQLGTYAEYAGAPYDANLFSEARDNQIGIRFQAVFLPVPRTASDDGKVEFYPDTYNYQTTSASDPRNIILLCTSQGTFTQQDGPGSQPQYLHKRVNGDWTNLYMEAMRTKHGVSMQQNESEEEKLVALAQGKAVSTVIGIRSMGLGFNRLMTVQVPLKQQRRKQELMDFDMGGMMAMSCPAPPQAKSSMAFGMASMARSADRSRSSSPSIAKAARVSYGSTAGPMEQLRVQRFERDHDCSITITVQFYFVVEEGFAIREEDVKNAIEVCEEAYRGCDWSGHLMDNTASVAFAKNKMSVSDVKDVATKITTQPPLTTFPTPVFPAPVFPTPIPTPTPIALPIAPPIAPLIPTLVATPTLSQPPKLASVFDVPYTNLFGIPSNIAAVAQQLPTTITTFDWLHEVGLKFIESPTTVDASFHIFRWANDVHIQTRGIPSATCYYNQACCLSIAVGTQIKQYKQYNVNATNVKQLVLAAEATGGVVAPALPPNSGYSVCSLVEARLDACGVYLSLAVTTGYNNKGHMSADPDLAPFRELRSLEFSAIKNRAE
eukprot:c16003_g1_i1.p1 GENE.c16003_g1_i1~~c16003_g1_i1.p1  ORF type:complete len:666 (+),score=143.99 c16003_g1_i1:68-1999(+)